MSIPGDFSNTNPQPLQPFEIGFKKEKEIHHIREDTDFAHNYVQPILAVINDTLGLEALRDVIIVKEDKFRTGYECTKCDGQGHSDEQCPRCKGERTELIDDKCTVCDGSGRVVDLFRPMPGVYTPGIEVNSDTKEKYRNCKHCNGSGKDPDFKNRKMEPGLYPCRACICVDLSGNARPSGFVPCTTCKGRGVSVLIPEDSVRRPNSGIVVSTGDKCIRLKPGERVLYSNHTGMVIEFKRGIVFRWMREDEVPMRMHGVGRIHEHLL